MRSPNDLWEALGELAEDELYPVLTRLFTLYETMLEKNPEEASALLFFRNLDTILSQTSACNLNRR